MYFDNLTWFALAVFGLILIGFLLTCWSDRESRACGNLLDWEAGHRQRGIAKRK
jgi:hypothetical protein